MVLAHGPPTRRQLLWKALRDMKATFLWASSKLIVFLAILSILKRDFSNFGQLLPRLIILGSNTPRQSSPSGWHQVSHVYARNYRRQVHVDVKMLTGFFTIYFRVTIIAVITSQSNSWHSEISMLMYPSRLQWDMKTQIHSIIPSKARENAVLHRVWIELRLYEYFVVA